MTSKPSLTAHEVGILAFRLALAAHPDTYDPTEYAAVLHEANRDPAGLLRLCEHLAGCVAQLAKDMHGEAWTDVLSLAAHDLSVSDPGD